MDLPFILQSDLQFLDDDDWKVQCRKIITPFVQAFNELRFQHHEPEDYDHLPAPRDLNNLEKVAILEAGLNYDELSDERKDFFRRSLSKLFRTLSAPLSTERVKAASRSVLRPHLPPLPRAMQANTEAIAGIRQRLDAHDERFNRIDARLEDICRHLRIE
eukprot:gnl/Dysnectes_brevis/3356_a4223_1069.p1 GENE.gnl/Dysnectes_brevis/3356_a4223_1069~~gnl/Dysnectes_brevis/3356_a4223_1069.p1  ORF type:complete len:160 (+),score=7.02 gnl/Dysnectes_brevis/3356_a4223_1069:243-722(+)